METSLKSCTSVVLNLFSLLTFSLRTNSRLIQFYVIDKYTVISFCKQYIKLYKDKISSLARIHNK